MLAKQESMLHHQETPKNIEEKLKSNQYNGECVNLAKFGDAKLDYEQPGENENINYRQWYIRPKDLSQPQLNMIIKGNFSDI